MKILKFGGTSVQNAKMINEVIKIIKNSLKKDKIAVVVSAFSGITDKIIQAGQNAAKGDDKHLEDFKEIEKRHMEAIKFLIDIKKQSKILAETKTILNELEDCLNGIFLIKELSVRSLDFIMSFGERLSAYIVSRALIEKKVDSEFVDSRNLVKTDMMFGNANVNIKETFQNIQKHFHNNKKLNIITGFIGSTDKNATTTLGRGGSDYSAALFGAALNVKEIEIWTDVDGVMTADPRKVKKAFSIPYLTYEEAMEMSHFGAKVIHPPAMRPATEKKIPMIIKNTFNPEFPGTYISAKIPAKIEKISQITGISSINNVDILQVQGSGLVGVVGVAKRLFQTLAEKKINIILISQASSEHSICIAINPQDSEKALDAIHKEFELEISSGQVDKVKVENKKSIIAVVGERMRNTPGISGKLFSSLGNNGINIAAIAQGSSELNISLVIDREDEEKALKAIHDTFFLSKYREINVFLIGTGLIGSTLLNQIKAQNSQLQNKLNIKVNIIGLGNSKDMIFAKEGIDLKKWQQILESSKEKMNIENFINKVKELNLPSSVFVDCTACEEVSNQYENILNSNVDIVTPNKKANSGKFETYKKLKTLTKEKNCKFLYETNVGAGLPILSTLHDLLISGDKILKIEAILSGTLSYIFNTLDSQKEFSEIIKTAKSKGFTEPDPRDDLSGLDVARKLLILSREMGSTSKLKDIAIEKLIPEECFKAQNIEDFFKKLQKYDQLMKDKIKKAQKEKKVLRYVATLENNKAQISLQSVLERTLPPPEYLLIL
ncbi:MAG: Bifunctional protein: aspartokinase I, homoserine dehydrogenase [Candidatus Peregrinibacteria bacterium GW2011_GWA2_33_10]|nr:MAG: Bifunctional protein: aspartokinase I, homoserine dehydrogenase [Candidatus Peregrinibacteria bacterium GW2011_GWA2_33_10]